MAARGGSLAGGHSVRRQGPVRQRRCPNGVRLTDVRGSRSRAGRRGGAARACGGRDPRGQDPDARVRVGDHVRQPRARLRSQPVDARASVRRLERRIRGRACNGRGAARPRQRYGGLDPRSRRVLRGRGAQADIRAHQRRPRLAARQVSRPPRADGALARGRRAPARGDCGHRPGRSRNGGRPARDDAGGAHTGARRARRRALPGPPPRAACTGHRNGVRGGDPDAGIRRCTARRARASRGGAHPADLSHDPERRGARHAPSRGPLPGAARRVRAGRPRTARRCGRGDARAVPRGVLGPAAHPGSVRARPRRVRRRSSHR